MTASIVNWINSGFHGDPTFISDPGAFFLDVANEITGKFMRDTALAPFCDVQTPNIDRARANANISPAREMHPS